MEQEINMFIFFLLYVIYFEIFNHFMSFKEEQKIKFEMSV